MFTQQNPAQGTLRMVRRRVTWIKASVPINRGNYPLDLKSASTIKSWGFSCFGWRCTRSAGVMQPGQAAIAASPPSWKVLVVGGGLHILSYPMHPPPPACPACVSSCQYSYAFSLADAVIVFQWIERAVRSCWWFWMGKRLRVPLVFENSVIFNFVSVCA